ncbi:MAG: corrinoid ABC transporter substrate-binding protein [Methanosaeta sp. PtaU1.Bin060]|uniref:ABC transporter substrate-binding protein n=1 Tax=Methanothrix TaxID=2222 RepID=UPI00064F959D|nr:MULTISPECIES: ABC transporter substrate-binding protein [Methanothrix]OPY54021.1 MAG: corrinoid ABC transporter substrate-binding protein [Methanosaeta sp. PtaU1.Bin060]HOE46548.1 ABC transporter substrate-binding protein [Methanothrix soehngenii]HOS23066.1 ABC transporter substrate-binding protein [Methanothrix soehngenii]HPL21292.1 ABC transporter substrate-binding protein [Methanothrix soehngenii]HPY92637.1 ABC transporter substrate-binding protein [Methanothrix soehngenii]
MSKHKFWALALLMIVLCLQGAAEETREVTDSRGVAVDVPADIDRVVTISDGLIEGTMLVLGEEDKIVGIGSTCLPKIWNYTYESVKGEPIIYQDGANPVSLLYPHLRELPIVANGDAAPNFEAIAELEPDVVILRAGDCSLRYNDETAQKTISSFEALRIPLVVLYAHNFNEEQNKDISTISDEIRIIGSVFGKEAEADELAEYLEVQVDLVSQRTEDVSEEQKPKVLILGLSPSARKEGGAGQVFGLDTIESYFIENLVHAENAYHDPGYFKTLNAEQLLALDPDAIVLCTASGYHPPRELYEAPYYQNLQEMRAVKDRNVTALPWSPCNCAKRLEYPIDVMVIAKAAYPDQFQDIDLAQWLLDFYKNVYGVDRETAEKLRSAQWMDWTTED